MFNKKPTQSNQAFTLLEMGLVLFILLLIAGMAIPTTSGLIAQERLKAQAKALQDYAVSARKLAITENRPYEIVLTEKGFLLQNYLPGETAGGKVAGSRKLSPDVRFTLQRWGARGFSKPAGDTWVFQPDGICEPIRVHFESREGWVEYTFNPLTARPRDESYHFP